MSPLKRQTPYKQEKDWFAFLDHSVSHCAEAPDGHLTFKYLILLALNLKHAHRLFIQIYHLSLTSMKLTTGMFTLRTTGT